MNPVLLVDLI